MNFNDKMKFYAEYTQKKLGEYNRIDNDTIRQRTLIEAMNYSLEAGGRESALYLSMHFVKPAEEIIKK